MTTSLSGSIASLSLTSTPDLSTPQLDCSDREVDELTAELQQLNVLGKGQTCRGQLDRIISHLVCEMETVLAGQKLKLSEVRDPIDYVTLQMQKLSLKRFSKFPFYFGHIESLVLRRCALDCQAVIPFIFFKKLQRVDLSSCYGVDDSLVGNLGGCSGLVELSLRATQISDRALEKMNQFTSLLSLNVSHTRVTDTGLQSLIPCKTLQHLSVAGCRPRRCDTLTPPIVNGTEIVIPGVTSTGLRTLIADTHLKTINVIGCIALSREDMQFAEHHKVQIIKSQKTLLVELFRRYCSWVYPIGKGMKTHAWDSYKGINFKENQIQLNQLLCRAIADGDGFLGYFFEFFRKEISAARLDIHSLEFINTAKMKEICTLEKNEIELLAAAFPNVKRISFERREQRGLRYPPMKITLDGLDALQRFDQLEELNFSRYHYCDDTGDMRFAQAIANCTALKRLNMSGTDFSDSGLRALASCTSLKSINISSCEFVHDTALIDFVTSCPSLQEIIAYDWDMDSETSDELYSINPNVVVYTNTLKGKNLEVSKLLCRAYFDLSALDEAELDHLKEVGESITALDFDARFLSESDDDLQILAVDGHNLRSLAELFPRLTRLSFDTITFSSNAFKALRNFLNLQELVLTASKGFGDADLGELVACRELSCLRLFRCASITDLGFKTVVESCNSILQIDVIGCAQISEKALEQSQSVDWVAKGRPQLHVREERLVIRVENPEELITFLDLKMRPSDEKKS